MKRFINIFMFMIFLFIVLSKSNVIDTPDGYYNLKRMNKFIQPPLESNTNLESLDIDLYYPDICDGAAPNLDGATILDIRYFKGTKDLYNTLLITKNTTMTLQTSILQTYLYGRIVALCIEGSLEILPSDYTLYLSALVILPGGKLISASPIELREYIGYMPPKDPFSFFPGILALGGSLTLIGDYPVIQSAQLLTNNSLVLSIEFTKPYLDHGIRIFTESNPQGFTCRFTMDSYTLINLVDGCLPISNDDRYIKVGFFVLDIDREFPGIYSNVSKGSSIYITGDTQVHIENWVLNIQGKTTNDNYNTTRLIFSPDDTLKVIDIIIGTNQKFRNSLYIEFSNNVTIKNCAIIEKNDTRSPLSFYSSKVNLLGNFISSKSGSSVIAEFGTEFIKSSDNYFFIVEPDSNLYIDPSPNGKGTGYECNGFYSLSPYIESSNDVFVGHKNAFKFNFIANRPQITGFDKDCYSPCYSNSTLVPSDIQFPIEFNITNPKLVYLKNSLNNYLLNINNNGNKPDVYYSLSNLTISDPVLVELGSSVLVFDKLTTNGRFSIDGNVKRLSIINSNLGPSTSTNNLILNSTISIRNSYIHSSNSIGPISSQVYRLSNTPYNYVNTNYLVQVKVVSIFPNEPHRVISNVTTNVIVQLQLIATVPANSLICIFSSDRDLITKTERPIDPITSGCTFPLSISFEGSFNLQVEIKSSSIQTDEYIYLIEFPLITSFNQYSFYSGWAMIDTNQNEQITVGGTNFTKGCQQTDGSCTLSNNIKYTTDLPTDYTQSTDYKLIFTSGITTKIENQPVTITTSINDTAKIYQIQLFFTLYQPNEAYPSLLSVNIEKQAVLILEPIQTTGTPFKNVTFIYENTNSLNKLNIEFITRGDIYLTSMAIYSSLFIPSNVPAIIPLPIMLIGKILAISLPIGILVLLLTTLTIGLLIRHKLQQKSKLIQENDMKMNASVKMEVLDKNQNILSVLVSEEGLIKSDIPIPISPSDIPIPSIVSDIQIQSKDSDIPIPSIPSDIPIPLATLPLEQSKAIVDDSTSKEQVIPRKPRERPIRKKIILKKPGLIPIIPKEYRKLASFPVNFLPNGEAVTNLILPNIYKAPKVVEKELYRLGKNVKETLSRSNFMDYDDEWFPLEFNRTTLEFGLHNDKAKLKTRYHDILEIKNVSDEKLSFLLLFPTDNFTCLLKSEKLQLTLYPNQSYSVKLSIKFRCTTRYYEKVGIQIEYYEPMNGPVHTYLNIHVESELTTKLNYAELEYEEFLGKGTYGIVYKGKWRGMPVAIKLLQFKHKVKIDITKETKDKKETKETYREIDFISKLNHKNIVTYIGCIANKDYLCIVTECAPRATLGNFIHDNQNARLSDLQRVRFALDIGTGLLFLHNAGIIHRDIKPDNILVFSTDPFADVCVKITDFGSSREITSSHRNFQLTGNVGTPIYMSSEVLQNQPYSLLTDVYSFGVTFYEMMVELIPFSEYNQNEIASSVIQGKRPYAGMEKIDPYIRELITKCWSASDKRPAIVQVVKTLEIIFRLYKNQNKFSF